MRVAAGRGTVYSGTKFAVKAISEGLRVEVAKDNIRVTTLYPGAVESELKYGTPTLKPARIYKLSIRRMRFPLAPSPER